MIAEIVSVGTELLLGQVLDTNARYLAGRLSEAGVSLYHHTTVGDNPARLLEALRLALSRADIVLTTGGLGPTADDLTKQLAAEALGLPMARSPQAEAMVRGWFKENRRPMTENNLRQADFALGARLLENRHGTAPGCIVEKGGKAVIHLPGPPREMAPMFEAGVWPYLLSKRGGVIVSRYLRVFGMGESTLAHKVQDLSETLENPTVAPYCSTGEAQLRLTVRCARAQEAKALLDPVEAEIRRRVGGVIYAVTDDPGYTMARAVVETLAGRGLTCATAESCTGGGVAAALTGVPGASAVFLSGIVAYANAAKEHLLGVPGRTLRRFGAVSGETALAMAKGLRARTGAGLCLSVTGVAGPGGGTPQKPVGLVWLGLAAGGGVTARRLYLTGDRERVRALSALNGLHWMLQAAKEQGG